MNVLNELCIAELFKRRIVVVETHFVSALHVGVDQDLALFLGDVGGSHGLSSKKATKDC